MVQIFERIGVEWSGSGAGERLVETAGDDLGEDTSMPVQ
jgi:hypothetical protein